MGEFRQPISVTQCFNCQSFGHSVKNCRSKIKCLICGEGHSHKGCPNKEAKCANCKGPHVASYKGCPEYKKQAFRQHVVTNKKSYATVVGQKLSPAAQNTTDIFFHNRTASKIRRKMWSSKLPNDRFATQIPDRAH